MNKNKTLAQKLLNWRNENRTSVIGHDFLTPDELAEALRLRWVESEMTESRHISNASAKLEEMGEASQSVDVGDTVTIGEDGQSYTATVSAIGDDGVRLSFGDRKPRNIDKVYRHDELRPVATPDVATPQGSKPVDSNPDPKNQHRVFAISRGFMR